jgi:hypothetical protein
MADNFGAGPAYGNWGTWAGHEATRPMESLKGNMGPVFMQRPMESEAMTGGRVTGDAQSDGPSWDDTFRAPMATPTRGTHIY